jgi:hypothetical protein
MQPEEFKIVTYIRYLRYLNSQLYINAQKGNIIDRILRLTWRNASLLEESTKWQPR